MKTKIIELTDEEREITHFALKRYFYDGTWEFEEYKTKAENLIEKFK